MTFEVLRFLSHVTRGFRTWFPIHPHVDMPLTWLAGFALAWSAMLWFDTVVFILTFYKAIQMRHERVRGLLVTMIRDGTSALSIFAFRTAE